MGRMGGEVSLQLRRPGSSCSKPAPMRTKRVTLRRGNRCVLGRKGRGMLTDNQDAAANHLNGPAFAEADAGSGKTTMLVERCRRLVRAGVYAGGILNVTFANKNVQDFRKKLTEGDERGLYGGVEVVTFHALARRIMGKPKLVDFGWLCREAGLGLGEKGVAELSAFVSERSGRGFVADLRLWSVGVREHFREAQGERARAWAQAERKRLALGVHTYDSMMAGGLMKLLSEAHARRHWQRLTRFIMADEYQDANWLQATLLDVLAERHRNLMVVGDDKQAIYSWRGAEARFLGEFSTRWPDAKRFELPDNFRCKGEVLASAKEVHPQSSISLTRGFGGYVEVADQSSLAVRLRRAADAVGEDSMAILVRTYAQAPALELALFKAALKIRSDRAPFFYQGGAKVLSSALGVLAQADADAPLRTPACSAGQKLLLALRALPFPVGRELRRKLTLQSLRRSAEGDLARFLDDCSLGGDAVDLLTQLELRFGPRNQDGVIRRDDFVKALLVAAHGLSALKLVTQLASFKARPGEAGVSLMSVHRAKGLEWPVVFVPGLERYPLRGDTSEERNLLFVALTRAKNCLVLSGEGSTPYLERGGAGAKEKGRRTALLLAQNELSVHEALELAELVQALGIQRYLERYFGRGGDLSARMREVLAAAGWSPKRFSRAQAWRDSDLWARLAPGHVTVKGKDVRAAWVN